MSGLLLLVLTFNDWDDALLICLPSHAIIGAAFVHEYYRLTLSDMRACLSLPHLMLDKTEPTTPSPDHPSPATSHQSPASKSRIPATGRGLSKLMDAADDYAKSNLVTPKPRAGKSARGQGG